MSLLLKALRQAEQSHAKAANESKPGIDELALEPMASTLAKPKREWVEPPSLDNDEMPISKMRSWRWPFGLVPTTAMLALLIALAYGLYFYWITRQQNWVTPASSSAMPAPDAVSVKPAEAETAALPAELNNAEIEVEKPLSRHDASPIAEHGISPKAAKRTADAVTSLPKQAPALLSAASPQSTLLEQAYAAFQAGRLDEAHALYQQRANAGPNADALLGLAAVALARGQTAEATRLYQAVLEISPRNPVAQAALIDTLGTTDPIAAESRIKSMIANEPSAFLFYALGNLYADQGRWSDAEQAYFEAYQLEPNNADYAFNLAVSLDHLEQSDMAVRYYDTALKLAGPTTRFDRAQAQKRLELLK